MSGVRKGVGVCVDNLALNLVGPTAIISQAASYHTDIDLGHSNGLSVVERLNGGQKIGVFLDQVGEVDQQLATVLGGLLSPCGLKCLSCGSYRNIDILLCGLVDGADNFFSGGVDGLEGLAVDTLHPLVVDEPAQSNLSVAAAADGMRGNGDGDGESGSGGATYSPVG